MSPSQKKINKTCIPVMKVTTRNGSEAVTSSTTACSRPQSQTSQSDSLENHTNQPAQQHEQLQSLSQLSSSLQPPQSSLHNLQPHQSSLHAKSKALNKKLCPETWADEVIQSQSQKLRHYSLNESRRRKEDMEKTLKEAEAQLLIMGSLLEQREKVMKEAAEEAAQKTEELEHKLHTQDCHLIKHGIDPVTGEQIILNEEGEKKVESNKKITKERVQEMRMKLKQMNNQAESYLSDIKNTLQYLNSLELASERAGQLSEGSLGQLDTDYDEIIKMYENYDKLQGSKETFITRLAQDENDIQNDNLGLNFGISDGDNAELLSYEASCLRLDEEVNNAGDKHEV